MPVEIHQDQMDVRAAASYLSTTLNLFSYLQLPLPLVLRRKGGFYQSEKCTLLTLPVGVVRVPADEFALSNAVVREIGMRMAVLTESLTSVAAFCFSSTGDTASLVWSRLRPLFDVPWGWAPAFKASRFDIRACLADLYGRMLSLCVSFGRLERAATIALHSGPWSLQSFEVSQVVQKASREMAAPAKRLRKRDDADLLVFGRIPLRISQRDKCILALRLIFDLYETAGCHIAQIKAAREYVMNTARQRDQ